MKKKLCIKLKSTIEFCQSGIRYLNAEETMFDCFTLSHEPMTFKEAVVYCGNKGLPLAKIDTELDHMNVIDKLKVNHKKAIKPTIY